MPTEQDVYEALRDCYDPEIPVNIVDLGLVYNVEVSAEGRVQVQMTLTAIGCPLAEQVVRQVQARVNAIEGVAETQVELVWFPPWDPSMASVEGRMMLASLGLT